MLLSRLVCCECCRLLSCVGVYSVPHILLCLFLSLALDIHPFWSCKAYESVSQFAAAYQLGATESAAAVNLLRHVPPSVKTRLTKLVRLCDVCVCVVSVATFSVQLGTRNNFLKGFDLIKLNLHTLRAVNTRCRSSSPMNRWRTTGST